MSVQSLMDRSRVLHEALEQMGWSDADAVVQCVQHLDIGLPRKMNLLLFVAGWESAR